jgi:hypothetical protein
LSCCDNIEICCEDVDRRSPERRLVYLPFEQSNEKSRHVGGKGTPMQKYTTTRPPVKSISSSISTRSLTEEASRCSSKVTEVLPLLYLHGLSSRDFASTLKSSSAPRLDYLCGHHRPANRAVAKRARGVHGAGPLEEGLLRLRIGGRDTYPKVRLGQDDRLCCS